MWWNITASNLADALSKFHDSDDWMLNSKYFRILDKLWGPHTFDRSASATNRHCMQFNSRLWCPGSAGVNALAFDRVGENIWVNPPFALIGKVLLHMKACKAVGTLWFSLMAHVRVVAFAACRATVPAGRRMLLVSGA